MCAELLDKDEHREQLLKNIHRAEIYLKVRFKTHCTNDDPCSSHCISHALSHPKDSELSSKCENVHNLICEECLNVVHCIASLKLQLSHIPKCRERDIAEYAVSNAESKILEWQRHIVRGTQQSKARSDAIVDLKPTKALWIRDFAQKYNPSKVKFLDLQFKKNVLSSLYRLLLDFRINE
jgi:hypothetical protein